MSGFEVVVRPLIFPDIRPRARQSLPPLDDPEKGMAKISGNPAQVTDISSGWSASSSHSRPRETERRVDDVRVYQEDDNGKVNKENFVDLEVANRIKMQDGKGSEAKPGEVFVPGGSAGAKGNSAEIAMYYAKQIEATNIEIKKRNRIVRNEEGSE